MWFTLKWLAYPKTLVAHRQREQGERKATALGVTGMTGGTFLSLFGVAESVESALPPPMLDRGRRRFSRGEAVVKVTRMMKTILESTPRGSDSVGRAAAWLAVKGELNEDQRNRRRGIHRRPRPQAC